MHSISILSAWICAWNNNRIIQIDHCVWIYEYIFYVLVMAFIVTAIPFKGITFYINCWQCLNHRCSRNQICTVTCCSSLWNSTLSFAIILIELYYFSFHFYLHMFVCFMRFKHLCWLICYRFGADEANQYLCASLMIKAFFLTSNIKKINETDKCHKNSLLLWIHEFVLCGRRPF